MDPALVPSLLAAGGTARTGESWRFVTSLDASIHERASTCWVVPFLPDGRTAAVWISSSRLHIPGGTLELGENWSDGARREVAEELGAEVLSLEVFGAIVSDEHVRLTAWADINGVGVPAEPDTSGVHVLEVRIGDPDEIITALEHDDQEVLADLYRLAVAVRAS